MLRSKVEGEIKHKADPENPKKVNIFSKYQMERDNIRSILKKKRDEGV